MGYVTAYDVADCPDHPSSALRFPAGVFCFACGHAVEEDVLGSGASYTGEATETLKAEARAAWNDSLGIRDFAASMQRAKGATPLRAAS